MSGSLSPPASAAPGHAPGAGGSSRLPELRSGQPCPSPPSPAPARAPSRASVCVALPQAKPETPVPGSLVPRTRPESLCPECIHLSLLPWPGVSSVSSPGAGGALLKKKKTRSDHGQGLKILWPPWASRTIAEQSLYRSLVPRKACHILLASLFSFSLITCLVASPSPRHTTARAPAPQMAEDPETPPRALPQPGPSLYLVSTRTALPCCLTNTLHSLPWGELLQLSRLWKLFMTSTSYTFG